MYIWERSEWKDKINRRNRKWKFFVFGRSRRRPFVRGLAEDGWSSTRKWFLIRNSDIFLDNLLNISTIASSLVVIINTWVDLRKLSVYNIFFLTFNNTEYFSHFSSRRSFFLLIWFHVKIFSRASSDDSCDVIWQSLLMFWCFHTRDYSILISISQKSIDN